MRLTKACTRCGEVKPLDEYHRDSARSDGRRSRCKKCRQYLGYGKLPKTYGMAYHHRVHMMVEQRGTCAICEEEPAEVLHIDHCHDSGKVRGLLCRGCNLGLGNFQDDPHRLRSAIQYLTGGD